MFLLAAALAPLTAEALTLKIDVQDVRMKDAKHGISQAERKNPKLLARRVDQKTLDHRVIHTSFGAQVSIVLPNGARLILTPLSAAAGNVKVHVRLLVEGSTGLDMDMKVPLGGRFPLPAGPYKDSMLMVMCTPSLD
ncbi:MAG TPA: hypothetical protein VMB50_07945 [Myxococcales bacterium]|nr:hypothetical protein [Myxococcales bacterium]